MKQISRLLILPALLLAAALPCFPPQRAHAADLQPSSTTYICSGDLAVDSKTIQGQVHLSPPPPELASVEVARGLRARDLILHGTKRERENEMKAVQLHPEQYPPAVFFFLARALWRDGQREDAAFWFYAGQLRTRYDAARCSDAAAKEAVTLLSESYGPEITEGLSNEIEMARTAVQKAVEWDRKTGYDYDQRWINLHAVTAYLTAPGAQIPDTVLTSVEKDRWPALAEGTRKQLLQEFEQAAAKIQREDDSTEDDDQD